MKKSRSLLFFDKVSRFGAIAGGWAFLALSFYIGVDVVLRKIFSISLQGSDEIGGYILATACTFGFSWTLKEKAHIRLGILVQRLRKSLRVGLNLLVFLSFTAFAYLMLWRGVAILIKTVHLKAVAPTPLETPLAIPQSIWVVGLLWFSLHLTFYLFVMIKYVFTKDFDQIIKDFGID